MSGGFVWHLKLFQKFWIALIYLMLSAGFPSVRLLHSLMRLFSSCHKRQCVWTQNVININSTGVNLYFTHFKTQICYWSVIVVVTFIHFYLQDSPSKPLFWVFIFFKSQCLIPLASEKNLRTALSKYEESHEWSHSTMQHTVLLVLFQWDFTNKTLLGRIVFFSLFINLSDIASVVFRF